MNLNELIHLRLCNQHIAGPRLERPEDVVRWMGAMQAQDYGQAVWAVALRTRSATLADVEQALSDRSILRTWPMRGTIHFVPAEDARWMLQLGAARTVIASRGRLAQLGLDEATLEHARQVFYDALHGDRQLSRPEMMKLLERNGISTEGQRGYHLLGQAALTGLICIGPLLGRQQSFALLDEWAANPRKLSREEGLVELAGRYFASHGPATARDFAWWAGLTLTEARAGLAAIRERLESATLDGLEYWWQGELSPAPVEDRDEAYLLPGFDEYLLGYTDRSAVLSEEASEKVFPGSNGMFRSMLVTGGQVTGVWKRTVQKKAVQIGVEAFDPVTVPQASLRAAAERYSYFLGLPLSDLRMEP